MALFPEARAAVEASAADLPVWSEDYDVAAARAANRAEALAWSHPRTSRRPPMWTPTGCRAGCSCRRTRSTAVVHLHGGGFVFNDIDVHDGVVPAAGQPGRGCGC